jgi:hypothetical protein
VPVIVTLLLIIASSAGCTTSSATHVQAYVDAMRNNLSNTPGLTVTNWQEITENSSTIRVRYDVYNSSDSYTTSMDLKVTEFQTTKDATDFVNSINTGYSTPNNVTAPPEYKQTMGHEPSTVVMLSALDSIIPLKARGIVQADEFVVYGSWVGYLTSPTPAPTATPSVTPSVTPSTNNHNQVLVDIVNKISEANATIIWHGDNSVTILQFANLYPKVKQVNMTFTIFPTTQAATDYMNAFDKTGYTALERNSLVDFTPSPTIKVGWADYTTQNSIVQSDNIIEVLTHADIPT